MIYYSNYKFDSEYYEYDFDTNANDIKNWFIVNWKFKREIGTFEFAIDNYRFDFISVNIRSKFVTIYEFKSSRSDFKSDSKWRNYKNYCDRLIFVCPKDCIRKNELDKDVGLYYLFKWKHFRNKLNSKWHTGMQLIKKTKRSKLDEQVYYRILETMLVKAKYYGIH